MTERHGGIAPIKGSPRKEKLPPEKRICCVCNKGDARHFCEDTQTYLHAVCAIAFLQSEIGKIVIQHGHHVHLHFRDE